MAIGRRSVTNTSTVEGNLRRKVPPVSHGDAASRRWWSARSTDRMPAPCRPDTSASTSPSESCSLPCTTMSSTVRNEAAGSAVAAIHPPRQRPPARPRPRTTRTQCRRTPSASRFRRGERGSECSDGTGADMASRYTAVILPSPRRRPLRSPRAERRRLRRWAPAPSVSTRSPGCDRSAARGATSSRVRTWCTGRSRFAAHRPGEPLGRDARERLLPRGEDVDENHDVGRCQHLGETVEEAGRPRVSMGLKDHHQPIVRLLAGRGQHRRDLGRVMAVVVDDPHAGRRAAMLEPPADAGEPPERRPDGIRLESHLQPDGEGGEPSSAGCAIPARGPRTQSSRAAPRRVYRTSQRDPSAPQTGWWPTTSADGSSSP